jgi:hypothetical protein
MVACTFVSAPIMFVSAKMMTVVVNSELDYKALLNETSFDISIVSIVCCVSTSAGLPSLNETSFDISIVCYVSTSTGLSPLTGP